MNALSAMTSGLNAYNTLSGTQMGNDILTKGKQAIAPVTQPIQKAFTPAIETAKSVAQPLVQSIDFEKRTQAYYKPFKSEIEKIGITYDDLAELPEEEKQQVVSQLRQIGVEIPGYVQKQEQTTVSQKPAPIQGEDLGIMGTIKQGAIGAFRAGEQIPEIAGAGMDYLTQNVTGPVIAGGLDLVGADEIANKWRAGAKRAGEGFRKIGSDITMAGMTDGGTNPLTQKEIDARKFGGQMALTAPIGGGYIAGAKGVGGLALRSGVVGAGFGAIQPIIDKGGEATVGDIATGGAIGGVTGAVAGPLISKVVAPAIGGIASKTGKYGQALIKGGAEGLKKSVARDIQAIKAPGVETVTRNIPKAVVRRDLGFTPTERAKIEKITGKDEGTYLLSKGLAGKGKEELAEVFMKQSDDMYNGITKNLSKVDAKVQSPIAKEALLDIVEQLESSPKIARAYAKDIEGVKAMLARDEFSLSELNNIRRAYDKVNQGMFTVQGKARSGLENAIDVKVRQDLSNQLQNEARKYGVDVKAMNTELRAGLEMKDALLRGLSQEEKNNFIGLQDLGVSAILSGGNPITAIATIGAKKYGEKIAPGLAQRTFNLNKSPNVTRNVSRGNTISTGNKSSRLGLASQSRDNVVPVSIKPIIKPTQSNIPGARKTTIETPLNPKGNESKILAKKQGVMVEKKEPIKLLPSGDRSRKQQLARISDDIASATKAAQYGGTGNSRVESAINSKLEKGEITKSEALAILEDVKTNPKYSYIDKRKLDEYITTVKGDKVETFDDLLNSKPTEIVTKKMTPRQMYDKLNEMANDGRFGEKSWNTLAEEFKAKTGKDPMDIGYDDFSTDGGIKLIKPSPKPLKKTSTNDQKGVVVPETSKNSPILKKTGVLAKTEKSDGKTSGKTLLNSELSKKMDSYKEIIANKSLQEEDRVFAMRDMYELMIKEGKKRGIDISIAKDKLKMVNNVIKEKYIDSRKLGKLIDKTKKEEAKANATIAEIDKKLKSPPKKLLKN